MLATLLIVFREVIEACLVAAFAGQIASLFAGSGQELFNASILLLAVGMLTWHNVWMASHGRAMAQEMRQVGAEVASGERPPLALTVVVGVAVLREGSEIVLFLYGIAASGGTSAPAMTLGGLLGLLAGAGVSALLYFGLMTIPTRRLFAVTSGLITLLAAGLAAQAVAFLQQGGYLELLSATVWNSAWLLSEDSMAGRLLHTLIGYSDAPSGMQLAVYLATIAVITGLMWLTPAPGAAGHKQPAT